MKIRQSDVEREGNGETKKTETSIHRTRKIDRERERELLRQRSGRKETREVENI